MNDWPVCIKTSNLGFLVLDDYSLKHAPELPTETSPLFPQIVNRFQVVTIGVLHLCVHSSPGPRLSVCESVCLFFLDSLMTLVNFWDSGAKPYRTQHLEVLTLLTQLDDI